MENMTSSQKASWKHIPLLSGSGGSKDDPKEYQFWSTQPVPGLHEVLVIQYTTLIQAYPVLHII